MVCEAWSSEVVVPVESLYWSYSPTETVPYNPRPTMSFERKSTPMPTRTYSRPRYMSTSWSLPLPPWSETTPPVSQPVPSDSHTGRRESGFQVWRARNP